VLKTAREKTNCHILGNTHKNSYILFKRNFASQNRLGLGIQNSERKIMPSKNTILGNTFENEGVVKAFTDKKI
jgi:hypothetical protein